MDDIHRVVRSIGGILERIPFDRPELRNRFSIETNDLLNIPFHIRRFIDVGFIYTDKVAFDACCVLQKTITTYTVIIIINKKFELNFQHQETTSDFLKRDYGMVCRRRELYCHEVCHLVAIIRAFPSYRDKPSTLNFLSSIFNENYVKTKVESLEKKFFQKTKESFNSVLSGLKTMMVFNITLSFNDFEDTPSEFDRDHFPYAGDELNYFKLFSEFMVSDKKLKKHMGKIPEYIRDGKIETTGNYINLERSFRDLLHVELSYIFKKAPEKRRIIIEEIERKLPPAA